MAKSDTTLASIAPYRHEQKRGRNYLISSIRTSNAGIFVCHTRRELHESRMISVQGVLLSRRIGKISTARRVLRRVRNRVPSAYLVVHESFIGALPDKFTAE